MSTRTATARWRTLTGHKNLLNTFSRPEEVVWDRCEHTCKDASWVAVQQQRPDARVLLLDQGHRASVQYPGLKNADGHRTAALAYHVGRPSGDTNLFFLGADGAGTPHFVAPAQTVFTEDDQVKGTTEPSSDNVASFVTQLGQPTSAKMINIRSIAGQLAPHESSLVAHAKSLLEWHSDSRFCGKCGHPTIVKDGGRSIKCPKPPAAGSSDSEGKVGAVPSANGCGKEVWPRTSPVAIMMVISPCGQKCLIGQTKERHEGDMYSVLAGFVDQGESLENGVRREVMEEAGVPVGEVQYHSSQPWPYTSNLMLGCFAQALTDTINFDPREMHVVKWATKDEIQAALIGENEKIMVPPPYALANTLMQSWVEGNYPIIEGDSSKL